MPRSLHASNSPLFIISLAHVLINDTSNFSASKMPGLTIGDTIPDLQVETNQGKIKLHQFCADGWTILCRSKLHDESRLIQGVLMITKMMTKSSKVKITS